MYVATLGVQDLEVLGVLRYLIAFFLSRRRNWQRRDELLVGRPVVTTKWLRDTAEYEISGVAV